jgi:heme-degrading monooxygenase HmoA
VIVRLWRGRVRPDQLGAYRSHLTGTVWPVLQGIDGFVSVRLFERPVAELIECLVMTEWTSWSAIRAFAGADPSRAVVEPAAQQVLADYDDHVEHFEQLDSLPASA